MKKESLIKDNSVMLIVLSFGIILFPYAYELNLDMLVHYAAAAAGTLLIAQIHWNLRLTPAHLHMTRFVSSVMVLQLPVFAFIYFDVAPDVGAFFTSISFILLSGLNGIATVIFSMNNTEDPFNYNLEKHEEKENEK